MDDARPTPDSPAPDVLMAWADRAATEGPYPAWLIAELRSDHAGETGAVRIYRGAAVLTRDPDARADIARHLAHEQVHLDAMDRLLPPKHRSRLLGLWRLAGWMLGLTGALFGARGHHVTVEAVETFVDEHYGAQIERLERDGGFPATLEVLKICRADEVAHRDEAAEGLGPQRRGAFARAWAWIVGTGSKAAVVAARRI